MEQQHWTNRRLLKALKIAVVLTSTITILEVLWIQTRGTGYMPVKPTVSATGRHIDRYITKYDQNFWKNTTTKKILVWTRWFGQLYMRDKARREMAGCPAVCNVTDDRLELSSSDAVLFHVIDLWNYNGIISTVVNLPYHNTSMPETRKSNQVWVLQSMEPVPNIWYSFKPWIYNWTMWYRRDATINMSYPDHWIKMTADDMKNKQNVPNNRHNYFNEKTKFVSTLVSNCIDQAERYRISRELKKHLHVDDFGSCSGNPLCASDRTEKCVDAELRKYKFYLAFENSFCKDYITEKFWKAIKRRQIPVIAAADYTVETLPPKSYLNVFDFPSIKALAVRMIEIGENEQLYNSYFDWMEYYIADDTSSEYCRLCVELHRNRSGQSYDMDGWLEDDVCQRRTTLSLVSSWIRRKLFDFGLY